MSGDDDEGFSEIMVLLFSVDFVYITKDSYTANQVLAMEREVLASLDYNVSAPIVVHFLRRFSRVAEVNAVTHATAKYVCELALVESGLAHVPQDAMAAAALTVAVAMNRKAEEEEEEEDWKKTAPQTCFYPRI
jgi:hypothetical protein